MIVSVLHARLVGFGFRVDPLSFELLLDAAFLFIALGGLFVKNRGMGVKLKM